LSGAEFVKRQEACIAVAVEEIVGRDCWIVDGAYDMPP
jgi:hypothetical protein